MAGITHMSSTVRIDPSYAAACAAMNQLITSADLPQEAYEATDSPVSETEQSAFMDDRVGRIVSTKPTMALADGRELHGDPCAIDCPSLFVSERMIYPRMQRLHSLLCAGKDPESISIVENAAGATPHVSMVLASMGFHVIVKDPSETAMKSHRRVSTATFPKDWLGRIAYFNNPYTVEIPTPSHLVYWTNPPNTMFMGMQNKQGRTPDRMAELADYVGRDVMLGGFLVIQTDDDLYGELQFDESRWQVIFDTTAKGRKALRGAVLPTFCYGIDNHLRIFKRIA